MIANSQLPIAKGKVQGGGGVLAGRKGFRGYQPTAAMLRRSLPRRGARRKGVKRKFRASDQPASDGESKYV